MYFSLFHEKIHSYGQKINEVGPSLVQGVQEGIDGLKEIRILGKEEYFHQKVRVAAEIVARYNTYMNLLTTLPRFLLELLIVSFIVLLVNGSLLLNSNLEILLPTLLIFALAALRLIPIANAITGNLTLLRGHRYAVSLLYRELKKHKAKSYVSRQTINHARDSFRYLSMDHIYFHYPDSSRMVLSDVSLEIHAGESIGLIGPSGSGKTTLVNVLLGLLEAPQGQLLYNGCPLKASLPDWRAQIAYLPQDLFLIDGTLQANITFGLDGENIDDARLHQALDKSRLAKLVEELPQGVSTLLGERGVRLSGGQRQRVALARAFYHQRTVLVMDEATSALDNETEQEVINEIQQLKGQVTTIVIAHRLATVQHCDRIYRLENGRIVKQGSYSTVVN